ncbi:MAG: hypothetical protein CSA55_01765 [Ilumatobacter coccineus]|uniref:S1 motif domain-containing protein n=1 Tax=Ilumatobacter coccineus TaxID=467094 RepID=A0A2G6KDL6_9ACTN|nr:MAG: hypothetical protein CSA55_01765 [Ilumatobacter coccineus]
MNIVDPPKAELNATYTGRVVNITKFGAFVNILPGRDGLVHISKLGNGKRISAVEDVLELGQEIEVTVTEIDDRGKVSLSPAGEIEVPASAVAEEPSRPSRDRGRSDEIETVSFDKSFDAELAEELGDLGPSSERRNDRGGRRRRHR